MGTYYFDSSAMVKHYISERGSEWVSSLIEAKMDEKPQNLIAIAEIGEVEVAAALAKRRRMKEYQPLSKGWALLLSYAIVLSGIMWCRWTP